MPIDSAGNVIPDFGDPLPGQAPPAGGEGEAATPNPAPVRRTMAFICSKGNLDMAYPALIMGNAALGEGVDVHLFFTFWGLDLVDVRTMDKLRFTFLGNTAMHMPQLERLRGGLGSASMPQAMAQVPGMTALATKMMRQQLEQLGIPTVRQMVEQVAQMGAKLWACKLTVDMMGIKKANLHPAVIDVISATDFIERTGGAQIVFI
ncbi:MAG: DsrE/DsrF/DrsH-like family protein [Bifidobacteriaceae bacterium]|jgi:peroxiredoxin family protein|nr:DsrE/DsrF/DrsH-like family protein [Bifidobacteriaceae bacterium]